MADKKIISPEEAFNWANQILNQTNPTTPVAPTTNLQGGPTVNLMGSQDRTEILRKSETADLQKVVFSDSHGIKNNKEGE